MCSTMTKEPCMFFWPPPICIIGEMKNMNFSITFQWLMCHARSYLTVSWNDRILNGARQCYQGRNLHSAVSVLWKSCASCSSAETDFCLNIPCQFVPWSVAYITADSCRITWGQLFAINFQKCWSVLSFCFRIIQHLITIMTCKTWCNGAGRC